ncbi:MAG: response regulator [Flavobacteriales bacterium]
MAKFILLIEDNFDMRENIAEILELAGYRVETAENGKIGVKKAIKTIPDIIVCDIMMPEMDGYEALYFLSKNKETQNIPFVFLTAKADKSDWRKGMNMGADDYITKPFEEMELLNVIETRLKRSEALKQKAPSGIEGVYHVISQAKGLQELKSLSEGRKSKIYKKKEILYREGDFASALYFVESGKVRTYKINEDAKEYTTGLFKDNDYLGYLELIKETEHIDTAVAMEDTEVYQIPKEDFIKLLYTNQEVSQAFIKLISGNLMEKEEELINLAYNTVRKRVADGLLLLEKRYKDENQPDFSISIPRDDLASIVGTSTESVIRVLSDFKSDGVIEIKRSSITLLESDKLKQLKF